MKPRYYYFIGLVIALFSVFNGMIWQKEQLLNDGEIVYLKLAPADPRSLMQGDYMRLRYAVDNRIERKQKYQSVIIKPDDNHVGQFVRAEGTATTIADGEKRFRLTNDYWQHIKPNTFFFQEGHAKYYDAAEYGVFAFAKDSADSYLLVGLADKDLQRIEVPTKPSINVKPR